MQEDTKQGCSISLSAVQGAPVNPFPLPASSAHPRLLEWSHSGVTNVPVCSKVPMVSLLTQLLPCSPWNCGNFGRSSVPQCSLQAPHHTWGPSTQPSTAWGVPETPEKLDLHQGNSCRKQLGCPHTSSVSPCASPHLQCPLVFYKGKTQQVRASAGDNEHNLLISAQEAAGMAATKS